MQLLRTAAKYSIVCLLVSGNLLASTRHPKTKGSLAPSHESLLRQNICVDQMGLERIQNEQELSEMVAQGKLRALPVTEALRVSPSLPQERRYVLSFVTPFLLSLSEQYYAKFGIPLVIDSAVRSREIQERLRRTNRAAAPVDGETASSHESGCTVDLSKRMSRAQRQWLEAMLSYEVAMNHVIVENEKACYHVMVLQ
jgi:hypothetical protein